jgi:hypothetical protein
MTSFQSRAKIRTSTGQKPKRKKKEKRKKKGKTQKNRSPFKETQRRASHNNTQNVFAAGRGKKANK